VKDNVARVHENFIARWGRKERGGGYQFESRSADWRWASSIHHISSVENWNLPTTYISRLSEDQRTGVRTTQEEHHHQNETRNWTLLGGLYKKAWCVFVYCYVYIHTYIRI